MVDDLSDDVWNFMSFCKKDFVKDSVPDQQLNLQELTIRYKGGSERLSIGFSQYLICSYLNKLAFCFALDVDTKKSVLKTIAAMDLDKINMDLVECLLEWIVDGKHGYPQG